MVSVKVFLGRFDMRTMQVATSLSGGGHGGGGAPRDGDGFTYEHLAVREEAWFDFVADTGDGGDSTYAVARCLAAPQLRVRAGPRCNPSLHSRLSSFAGWGQAGARGRRG